MFQQAYASLLSQLAEMPLFLQHSLAGLPTELLQCLPENDKSPLLEHLWHIRDCESDLYGLRIHQVLREPRPNLEPVEVGHWPAERGYLKRDGKTAIAEFAALRNELISELSQLEEPSISRVGIRFDGTEINILGLVEQVADHDRDHRWRIAAILRSFGGGS
jgi:DinB superfamily